MDGAADRQTEVEWQFDAHDLRPVRRWLDVCAASSPDGVTIGPGRTATHVDVYFDTAEWRLRRAGFSVRLRLEPSSPAEATLKSLPADGAGADGPRVRREISEKVDGDGADDVAATPGPVGERVRALAGGRRLLPLFEVRTRRRVLPLTADGAPGGEIALDDTAIRSTEGSVLSRLRRVEVEVPSDAVEAVEPLVQRLETACRLQPARVTKYEAGLVSTGVQMAAAETFGETAIGVDDRIGAVALAVLRRHFAAFLEHEPGTRLGDDAEELHDMRVASRRLRAAMALFADVLPAGTQELRREIAWVGQTIGAVRDLDVQLLQLDEWSAALPEDDREPLARLRTFLLDERAQARATMLARLDSRRYETLVRRLGRLLRTRSGVRTPPARAVAPAVLERRHDALRGAAKRIGPHAAPAEYHRLRIAAKRFRYALESLADVYPGTTERLVKRAVAAQDILGAYQDANVAIQRLRRLAAERGVDLGPETAFAMGEVAERYRREMTVAKKQVPRVCRRLDGGRWRAFRKHVEKSTARHRRIVPSG